MGTEKSLGRSIRQLREETGRSQEEFGAKLRPPVSGATVSRWEADVHTPSAEHLRAISEAVGRSPDYFALRHRSALDRRRLEKRIEQAKAAMGDDGSFKVKIGTHRVELLADGSLLVNRTTLIRADGK